MFKQFTISHKRFFIESTSVQALYERPVEVGGTDIYLYGGAVVNVDEDIVEVMKRLEGINLDEASKGGYSYFTTHPDGTGGIVTDASES